MGKVILDLPDDLIDAATKQSEGDLNGFIQDAIEAAIDYGAPESVKVRSHKELIKKLEEGLDSGPGRELTDADFERWSRIARGEESR